MSPTADVVVVGAGIVGAACAAECAEAGLRVAIVERGPIGGGATAAGMGHVVVIDDSEAQLALTRYSRALWHELADQLPPGAELLRCGTLWIAADDAELEAARRKQRLLADRGVPAELLDAPALSEAEPALRAGLAGGLRVPGDLVVYPPVVARFLVDRALARGALLHLGMGVATIDGGDVRLEDGGRLSAGKVVNATGQWAPALAPGLQVRSRKGQLLITDRHPGFLRHQLIELGYLRSAHADAADSVAFNAQPRATGQILLGSSRQFDAEDTAVQAPILRRMIERARAFLPGLERLCAVRCWAGHRAATPDKLPLIGPSRAGGEVILATGHEGLGITTSLGTARLVRDTIVGGSPEIDPAPYLPSRFQAQAGHA